MKKVSKCISNNFEIFIGVSTIVFIGFSYVGIMGLLKYLNSIY